MLGNNKAFAMLVILSAAKNLVLSRYRRILRCAQNDATLRSVRLPWRCTSFDDTLNSVFQENYA
jgi:hypothetical protein